MKKTQQTDSWCSEGKLENDSTCSGAAMREHRIAQEGGMDAIIAKAIALGAANAADAFSKSLGWKQKK